jgi:hypothetical protein
MQGKVERIDHIWPVKLRLTYITNQQELNSIFGWSIKSDQPCKGHRLLHLF